jgi:hypothetical protein
VKFSCVLHREYFGSGQKCSLPQWCEVCKDAHDSPEQVSENCRIAPICQECSRYLYDRDGRSPGFVRDLAIKVV